MILQRELAQLVYPSSVRPFSAGQGPVIRKLIAGTAGVVVLAGVAFAIVQLTGGSPNTLNHLGYAPIIVAAYLFGWRGAIPAALFSAALLGPGAGLVPGHEEAFRSWFPRAVMFVGVGSVVGSLFDLSRHAAGGWRRAAVEIAERERDGMIALARGAEAKDTDTGEHIQRVRRVSEELALATGMDVAAAAAVGWSAMLHDVGKLHVPDAILVKPGQLTAEEWEVMRQHPVFGERILAGGPGFEMARRIARWHHENFDGSGYPDGLRRGEIPLEARIVRITDALDAMTHDRPYKAARSLEWAMSELERCGGSDFDPDLVAVLVRLLEERPQLVSGHQPPVVEAPVPHVDRTVRRSSQSAHGI